MKNSLIDYTYALCVVSTSSKHKHYTEKCMNIILKSAIMTTKMSIFIKLFTYITHDCTLTCLRNMLFVWNKKNQFYKLIPSIDKLNHVSQNFIFIYFQCPSEIKKWNLMKSTNFKSRYKKDLDKETSKDICYTYIYIPFL